MIRFMSDTRYAGLEKEMQHIPGFRPRRNAVLPIVSRFMSFWRCWQRKWLSAPL